MANGNDNENNNIKTQLADEESTKKGSLTLSDRKLLRGYFGFSPVLQCPEFPVRRLSDASSYVKSLLLTHDEKKENTTFGLENNNNNKQQPETGRLGERGRDSNENNDEPFDLAVLLDGNMPRIFENSMENLIQVFREGSTFTDSQMAGVLRTFSAFSRLYERDLAVSSGYCRLLLIGPVMYDKQTKIQTDRQIDRQSEGGTDRPKGDTDKKQQQSKKV